MPNTKSCIIKGFDVQQTAFAMRKYEDFTLSHRFGRTSDGMSRTPPGVHQECFRSASGVHQESSRSPSELDWLHERIDPLLN